MNSILSDRVLQMEESATLAMAKKARELKAQGIDIISLSLGEPDFKTPKHIQQAAKDAIDEGKYFSYPPVAGYQDLREAIAKKLKSIDILVNNAGIPQIGNLEKTSPTDFQNIFDVNVKGAYHCMYAFIPAMIEQKSGVILNMASVAASVGIPDRFGYSMTKGAIKSMTQSVSFNGTKTPPAPSITR